MSRLRIIAILVFILIVTGVVAAYRFLPKRYMTGERLAQATVFWHQQEAFIFLNINTSGRSTNLIQDKISALPRYGYFSLILGAGPRFIENRLIAYRLLPSGELTAAPLPPRAASFGSWALEDGNLALTPSPYIETGREGFRWDGTQFVGIDAEKAALAARKTNTLRPDDAEEDDGGPVFLSPSTRQVFKTAGWHYKQLGSYSSEGAAATLPLDLGSASYNLTVAYFPPPVDARQHFDLLTLGAKSLEISSAGATGHSQPLWSQKGWQTVSQNEFDRRARQSGRAFTTPTTVWIWCAALVVLVIVKLGSWGQLFLLPLALKQRVLKSLPTSFAFPPATPLQFPKLDTAALDRYTQEFEKLGFVRLLDFSLVSDAPKAVPTFCRLVVNTRHHCFGEFSQAFPSGKTPLEFKCSITGCLDDGWSLTFSDRKPMAASSLLRRKRAPAVSMPEATPYELLNAFLEMRNRICQELGIGPVKDDTTEAYFARVQGSLSELREVVKQKHFSTAIPRLYWQKFSLLKTKPEYVWLGDYPKEAERRRQGFAVHAPAI